MVKPISYKLAVALQEANFLTIQLTDDEQSHYQQVEFIDGVFYHIPNLSELIEACGTKFGVLKRIGVVDEDQYRAEDYPFQNFCDAKTPEEAVAKLWLKLNRINLSDT